MDDENVPHDRLHQQLFSHREVVEDLLRQVIRRLRGVGGPWVDELDWTTLKREPETSTAPRRLDRRVRDLVWSIAWRGSPLYLILLIEFQARPDRFMPLRQLTYLALFYEDLIKSKGLGSADPLPPALPICLYSGDQPWKTPTRFEALLAPCPRELWPYQLKFRQLLIVELKTKVDLKAPERNAAGSVFALQQVDHPDHLLEVLEAIERWLPPEDYAALRRDIITLMRRVLPADLLRSGRLDGQELEMSPKEKFSRELRKLEARKLSEGRQEGLAEGRQEGRAEGRQEGRAEGRQEGRLEGQRKLLAKQLRLKFGVLPAAVENRLLTATGGQLESWAERVLTAADLDQVFA